MCRSRVCRAVAVALIAYGTLFVPLKASADVVRLDSPEYVSLSGYVYADMNDSCELEVGEFVIPNVTIVLARQNGEGQYEFVAQTTTGENGAYAFDEELQLSPGTYSLTETQPVEFLPGMANAPGVIKGKPAGHADCGEASGPDSFINITLYAGDEAIMYNFGEAGLRSAYISKRHFLARHTEEPTEWVPDPVPEPAGAMLLVTGLLLLCGVFRWQPKRNGD
ncbi:MAG: hypothetical protein JW888_14645 [Pirellulales bacterium]|nr:hypothetical protein [Pirellulales bacterium]